MKKIICVLLVLMFCLSFLGCTKNKENKVSWPLTEINAIYDSYGNLLQQILYNEKTEEYIIKEFTWSFDGDIWTCVDRKTTLVQEPIKQNQDIPGCTPENSLSIYYIQDLAAGSIILLDNSDVKVSIVEYLEKASWWEFGYKLKIENKSNEVITYMFDDVSIMDINCKPMFSIDHIEPGQTTYFNIAWDKDSLEKAWIPYINNIKFMLRIYNNDNWRTPALYGTKALIKHEK